MSNSFWNIYLIVSRFVGDELQPIWSKCVKFHGNRTKILETTALLRMCIEIFFNKAFFPDFAHYGLSAPSVREKKMIFLIILIEFIISESLKAILKFWKIRPLSAPPEGAGGPLQLLREGEFFEISESLSNFQIWWIRSKWSRKPSFFAHRWCWEAIISKIGEKSLVEKNFDTHS